LDIVDIVSAFRKLSTKAGQAHLKTEVIRRKGPWNHLEAVEFATLEWVDWFNHRRVLGPLGYVAPAEYEARYYAQAVVA
jgi:putative transposase